MRGFFIIFVYKELIMEHNFIKGLINTILAYLLMQLVAYCLLGPVVYQEDFWPTAVLWVFIPIYLISVGYSLTQSYDASLFEYAKDVSDGFIMAFLFHYMVWWKAAILFFVIAYLHRTISAIIKAVKDYK